MEEIYPDFPEYGMQVELKENWRGYHRATVIDKTLRGFMVQVSSGAEIEVTENEIEFD